MGKPEFDCLTLDETYDCGCGDESATGTAPSAPKTKGHNDDDAQEAGLRGEKEGERGFKDELVLGHGGGEVHVNHNPNLTIDSDEDENEGHRKGIKWTEDGSHHGKYQEERPIHNVPKLPIRPVDDENSDTAMMWDEKPHQHQDEDGDEGHSSGKKKQKQQQHEHEDEDDELQREYENEQNRYEKERDNVKDHDGSRSIK